VLPAVLDRADRTQDLAERAVVALERLADDQAPQDDLDDQDAGP
jgi:hypothetical protein